MKKIKSKKTLIKILSSKKKIMNKHFNIDKIYIFGSFSRENFNDKSDIDILINVPDSKKSLINRLKIKYYLEHELGRTVDISYFNSLHPAIKNSCKMEILNV